MAAFTMDEWIGLVERCTRVAGRQALRADKLYEVERVLRHSDPRDTSREAVAASAANIARELQEIKPLRFWLSPWQASVAAATAVAHLRHCGWAPELRSIEILADDLRRRASLARLLARILSVGGAPVSSERQDVIEVYLSIPVSGCTPSARALLKRWSPIIEEELEAVGTMIGIPIFLRVPGLARRSSDELVEVVRSGLRRSALHLVVGARGGSTGVGIEIQNSLTRRRPVVWLVPPGEGTPSSVVAASLEGDISVVAFDSEVELRAAVRANVIRKLPAIKRLLDEKDAIPVRIIELQEEMRRNWLLRASTSIDVLHMALEMVGIKPARAVLLLTNPFVLYHQASASEIDDLCAILGMEIDASETSSQAGATSTLENVVQQAMSG